MVDHLTTPALVTPIERALESFKSLKKSGEITAWVQTAAQPGHFTDFPENLAASLKSALLKRGIRQLYTHQFEAYDLVKKGKHLVVVTPTASGKTLCYNLPVLNDLIEKPQLRALYLFPTKALAQDQMAELRQMVEATGHRIGVHTYDGDTPADMRPKIRREARIVLTNPDMLHSGILPHHPKWIELLQNLKYVIVDELHTYRGIFGSHVCNVFRRLMRVAHFYHSEIQFVCASATIANPQELAEKLLEKKVQVVDQNGAPQSKKDLIFYNPPLTNPELGLRRSAFSAARRFAEQFLKHEVQTLVFATSRVNVEVLLRYLKNAFDSDFRRPEKIRGYRGGYLPRARREIEQQLRDKEILGVVSTNALELGIDIGSLDACVMAGYPGSVASTWQQIGRAGRRKGRSVAVLVGRNLPLDQFIVLHPEYFLGRSPEHGLIQPDNLQILVGHIKCAAFELPFQKGEHFGSENLKEILDFLAEQGILYHQAGVWNWTDEAYPADSVSLRNIPEENFVVFNANQGNEAIAEVDFDSAPELIHDDAVYMCQGRQYHVEKLDYPGRKAYVREVNVDYYTQAITYSGLRVLRCEDQKTLQSAVVEHGEVHLVKRFPGFKKIKFYTSENLGYGKIHLPVHELHTMAYWFAVPETNLLELSLTRNEAVQGFLGVSYAIHHIATLILMCDIQDLGRSVGDRSTRWFALNSPEGLGFYSATGEGGEIHPDLCESFDPTIFIYDNCPGGVGFSEKLFECHHQLLEQTLALVQACRCKQGCPSCVGPVDEVGRRTKGISREMLRFLAADGSQESGARSQLTADN
ncbi:DEAD/DEAH box helicase [Acidobacteria bacterium AH-259-A15]|nr:DEAD/DEAH box helicase [Acidobacteria bacterium AH-259-A15]